MAQYQLTLFNNSGKPWNLVIYQQYGNGVNTPIAWRSKYLYSGTRVTFRWDSMDWNFVWAAMPGILPGTIVEVGQVIAANLNSANQVTLSYDGENRAFHFGTPTSQPPYGRFEIRSDASLPFNAVAGGIGMAGSPTLMTTMAPNMNYDIMPGNAQYWITYGDIVPGQFFTIDESHAHQQIEFPANVYAMTATLNSDNTWTVHSDILLKEEVS